MGDGICKTRAWLCTGERNLLDVSVDALSNVCQALLMQMCPHMSCGLHTGRSDVRTMLTVPTKLYSIVFQVINICTWMGQGEYEPLTVTVLLPWIQSTGYRNSEESVLFSLLWGNRLDYLEKLPTTDISRNIIWTSESYWIHQYFVLLSVLSGLTV